MESVLITFDPHPRKVLFPDGNGLKLLTTLEEKLSLLETTGVDTVVIQPFTLEFSRLTALHYVRDLLVKKLRMKQLVIGYDHQFGKNREGNIDQLREYGPLYGFDVVEIPAQYIDEVSVSSTKIRKALSAGDVATARLYLDYHYFITGEVVQGKKRGKGLGFPTANVHIPHAEKLIPAEGVYAVTVGLEGEVYKGMMNIGFNPTFEPDGGRTLEVHMFDFDRDIYGRQVRVYFHERIRSEEKFATADELIARMKLDQEAALSILG